jgi:hypothetical protein
VKRSRRLASTTRLFGPPPTKDATQVERARYVRRICLRTIWLPIPVIALALAFGSTFLLVVSAGATLFNVVNVAVLELRIRRAERRVPSN